MDTVDFYRIVITELMDDGVSVLTAFVLPDAMGWFHEMFEQRKERYVLSDPEFVSLKVDPVTYNFKVEGEKNLFIFVGDTK